MANHVIVTDEMLLEQMRKYYAANVTSHLPAGALFVAKLSGCTITAYRSGKVLFQGKAAEEEAAKWQNQTEKKKTTSPAATLATVSAVGSDEVGTGDYFGPIVVAAAYVDKEHIKEAVSMGVKDSKQLTDETIIRLAPILMDRFAYETVILANETYNEWQQNGMPQTKIKALLHNQAIRSLTEKLLPTEPEAIIIDQFIEKDLYFRYLENEEHVIRKHVYCYPKAETIHIAVAAASIIARYVFLQEMKRLSNEAGIQLPKGAGMQVDQAAATLIQLRGITALNKYAKVHFANTNKAMQLSSK
ncbi:ribonuclease HIII [Anoxybacteroides tepidamans]|uniref:ribonuclease HIII n=1 Tax=Anoxybacteroides tepidamans TaxID=265948 RepID=UPI0004830D6B|nr:ribonuclease HIII [Anoxybacillus tepidamans]